MLCAVKNCRCPVDEDKIQRKKLNGQYVCEVCFEMFVAIYKTPFFVRAQAEYVNEVDKINRLKPGADYFQA